MTNTRGKPKPAKLHLSIFVPWLSLITQLRDSCLRLFRPFALSIDSFSVFAIGTHLLRLESFRAPSLAGAYPTAAVVSRRPMLSVSRR